VRFWPQDEHQTLYAISLLKHVVILLNEGLQKLTTLGIDVNIVARTIDVCICKQESHRQPKLIMGYSEHRKWEVWVQYLSDYLRT
jgi:hypothetical protein